MKKDCKFNNCYLVGPTGPRGEADTIEVRNTTTVAAGEKALVIDTYNLGKHILDFQIPMGVTGPIGPTGPEFIKAFGHKFSDIGTVLNLEKQVSMKIPLNRNGEAREIDLEDNSDFIILENGIYKLEYYLSCFISSDTAFFTELLKNGDIIDGSTISKDLVTNTDSDFYGAVVTTLRENDRISLGVRANNDVVLTLNPDTNAYVIITKMI